MKNVAAIYPATGLQQGMLFDGLRSPGIGIYLNQLDLGLAGSPGRPFDSEAWKQAWARVVARHPVLRTAFAWEGLDDVLQVVRDKVDLPWREIDARQEDEAERQALWERLVAEDLRRDFDPRQPPLLRFLLLRTGDDAWRFLWSHHHLLIDGWSLPRVVDQVVAVYGSLVDGTPPPDLPGRPFEDYVAWLTRRDATASEGFWRRRLAGLTAPTPLGVHRLPAAAGHAAAEGAWGKVEHVLDPAAVVPLRELAARRGLTTATLAHALWALLLARYSGDREVVFGTVVAGRPADLPGAEQMIGLFINSLPLRVAVDRDQILGPWLDELQARLLELRDHEHDPLARVQAWSEVPSGTRLFDSLVAFQNIPERSRPGDAPLTLRFLGGGDRNGFPLTIQVAPGARWLLRATFARERFDDATAERLLAQLAQLAAALPEAEHRPLADLPILPPAERRAVVAGWNDTAREWELERTLHARIVEQMARTPSAEAVSADGESWSYAELDRRSATLAARLRRLGAGPGVQVAVVMERSRELLAALVAILRAGGAYLPLDPDQPAARAEAMAADAGVPAILTQPHLAGRLPARVAAGAVEIVIDAAASPADDPAAPPADLAGPADLAYVIYTSGSTGPPKGVMVPHRGIVNRLLWMQEAYPLRPGDRVLQKTPIGFDVSVWELFWPLLVGATVVMARPGGHRDPSYLVDAIVGERISTVHFVPSMLQHFLGAPRIERARRLTRVIASGEALPADLVARFHQKLDCPLVNLYGPTEASVDVTAWECRPEAPSATVPIGRPIANIRTFVVDRAFAPCPIGVAGELLLGGVGLARGYLGRPALTAERFVPDPFAGQLAGQSAGSAAGERLYRTGDLARWLPDGSLEFLGRLDHQVKVRGFRVELGEIEATLTAHPEVREAVVVTRGTGDDSRLVAYLVAAGERTPAVESLRDFLAERLPQAMLPAAFVVLAELPLGPSGKVDRRALPEPEAARPNLATDYRPPRTPREEVLSAVFAQVLGIDRVGVDDSFFALGGDSLKSLRLVAVAAERGLRLTLDDVYRRQTLGELAARVDRPGAPAAAPPDPAPFRGLAAADRRALPADVEDAYPLARLQAGMLVESEREGDGSAYHDHLSLRIAGRFDPVSLRRALDLVATAHPALRTDFDLAAPGGPLQRVRRQAAVPLAIVDLAAVPPPAQGRLLAESRRLELSRPFAVDRAPLLRATVHRAGAERWQLGLGFHHGILDGLSFALFTSELLVTYSELLAGRRPRPVPPRALPREHVEAERTAVAGTAERAWWRERLAGLESTRLPALAETLPGTPGPGMRRVPIEVPEAVSEALLALARREAIPVKSVLLAAHLRVIAHLTGRRRVTTGLVVHNRPESPDGDRVLGLFLNTLPIVAAAGGRWLDLVEATFTAEQEALHHSRLPLGEVLAAAGAAEPPFDTIFNFAYFDTYDQLDRLAGLRVEGGEFYEEAEMPLAANFSLSPADGKMFLGLEVRDDALGAEGTEIAAEAYRRALAALAADPEAPVAEARLMAPALRERLLGAWAVGPAAAARETLHGPVLAAAAADPEAIALVAGDEHWSYARLAARSAAFATALAERGVGPEVRVGVLAERSPQQVAALLGVLRAGGAWVPLDPALPPARLAELVADSAAHLVAGALAHRPRLSADVPFLAFEEIGEAAGEAGGDGAAPDHLAYVFFTSGSTGRPKGVMVGHAAAAAAVAWRRRVLDLGPGDRVLGNIPPSFDPSVWQTFGPLGAGATLVLATAGSEQDAERITQLVADRAVDVVDLPPALFHEVSARPEIERRLAGVRTVFIGGQSLPAAAVERSMARLPASRWIDVYGPTEAVIEATAWECRAGSGRRLVPIGRPTDGRRVLLLAPDASPVPPGTPGMLWIGGEGLARGYQGRPADTADAFRPDPFAARAGSRLYRTGDLARWLPDGEIEFLGRADRQIKIAGLRIEPGEIEAVLAEHPAVREAVVEARELSPGDTRLVAWIEAAAGAAPDADELRAHAAAKLASGAVPSLWQVADRLPRSSGGKVDRAALATPEPPASAGAGASAPRGSVEQVLAAVWSAVLGVDAVAPEDDFFALGGHSLAAAQAVARARTALGVELPLGALYEAPTLAALAERVEAARRGEVSSPPPIERLGRERPLPLSFAQERLWFFDHFQPGSAAYNVVVGLDLAGAFDLAAVAGSIAGLVARHEALRTRLPETGGEPVQEVMPVEAVARLPVIDLPALPPERRVPAARAAASRLARRPLDLARGPLFAPALLRLAPRGPGERSWLLLVLHHAICDGRSIEVLLADLAELYRAALAGEPAKLAPQPVGYADFAVWQRRWLSGPELERQLAFWRRRLATLAPLELPADRPRPAVRTQRGGWVPVEIDPDTTASLRTLGRRLGATPFMVLLAGFAALLGRLAHRDDLAIGTPIGNRPRPEVADVVGLFVNTLVLRSDLAGRPGFAELVERTRAATLEAFLHQDLPFEKLVEELAPARDTSRSPLAQVVFVLQNAAPPGGLRFGGAEARPFDVGTGTAKFDLTLSLGFDEGDGGERLHGSLEYDADLFDPATVERLARRLARLLAGAAADPEAPVAELGLLSESERLQVASGRLGAPAAAPAPGDGLLHERFLTVAAARGDAVALSGGGRETRYAELAERADRLARRLAALGVGPEARVGLAAGRQPELVVGVLGILMAGGAYVPLDPAVPPERLAFLIADAGVTVVVGDEESLAALPEPRPRTLRLEVADEDGEAAARDGGPPAPRPALDPDHVAYVIYTSGSTGRPKGVQVTHRQALRLFDTCQPLFGFGAGDVWTLFHSYAFDFSVWEIWGALLYGGRLVVVPYWVSRSPDDLLDLLADEGVTVLSQTPSAFRQLSRAEAARPDPPPLALRWVVFGGEALDLAALAPWFARHGERPRLVNMYGITETTVHVTHRELSAADAALSGSSRIGGPLPDLRVHLLDRHGEPVPPGVPGEIHVAGGGVARGYLGQPGLTAARFVPDPFDATGGGRLYRSGDLARWLPMPGSDGWELEVLGRIDQQVQVRGFRVEPGEIEAALCRHPAVGDAVALPLGEGDALRLVAYVVPADGAAAPAADVLRAFLQRSLPDHMVPSAFVAIDALPLTVNGKLDRAALPAPDDSRPELAGGYAAPRTAVETELVTTIAEILGLDRVGIHDNFFDLGGQSLLAVRTVTRLRDAFGVELPLQALFSSPTVADLAVEIVRRQAAAVDDETLAALLTEIESMPAETAGGDGARRVPADAEIEADARGRREEPS